MFIYFIDFDNLLSEDTVKNLIPKNENYSLLHSFPHRDTIHDPSIFFVLAKDFTSRLVEEVVEFRYSINTHMYVGSTSCSSKAYTIFMDNGFNGIFQIPLISGEIYRILRNERQLLITDDINLKAKQILNSIYTMTRAVADRPDIEEYLQLIVDVAAETLDADRLILITIDSNAEVIRKIYEGGVLANRYSFPEFELFYKEIMEGLTGWSIRNRQTAFSPKNTRDPREPENVYLTRIEQEVGSIIVTPVYTNDIVYGTITAIKHNSKRDFFPDEVEMLNTYATFVTLNLENYMLLEKVIDNEKETTVVKLINGFAHRINTPLGNSITSFSYITKKSHNIQTDIEDNNIKKSDLIKFMNHFDKVSESVTTNLQYAKNLINDIKNLTKFDTNDKKSTFLLKNVIKDAAAIASFNTDKIYCLEIDCQENLQISTYKNAIIEIFSSLILNSIIHGFNKNSENIIEITVNKKSKKLYITYRDNGKGIAEENSEKIFSPFFTTNLNQGFGIGLSRVKTLLEKMLHGSIKLKGSDIGVMFEIDFSISD
jgi:signal transduction histidine kinase